MRALLLEDPAHDVDPVHQDGYVDDHHEDVGEDEALPLVRGLLAALAELEGIQPGPAGQLAHRLGIEAGAGEAVCDRDVVDRALEHADELEGRDVRGHVLGRALVGERRRQHQDAVEVLGPDLLLEALARGFEV